MSSPISLDTLEAAHWLIAGTTGSGKTYLARGLLEQLRRGGRRVGAIDPRSKLWGLTVSADGKGAGLEFVIFGGKRPGAVPMRPSDGDRLGRLFVERNIPAIFDLYGWDEDDQALWVDAFARAVFATNTAALHLAIDEAQTFVPSRGVQGAAYKAIKLLATQGRGDGINLLMTAPRLDGVDVDVRQALGGMVAMRQTALVDRKAVAELIGGHLAIDERVLRDDLASLPTGTGIVWSPGRETIERTVFFANATFDSSRTPRHGDAPPPPIAVSSALVEELRAALARTAPEATAPSGSGSAEQIAERDRRIEQLQEEAAMSRIRADDLQEKLHRARRLVAEAYDPLRKLMIGWGSLYENEEAPAVVAEAAEGGSGSRAPSAHATGTSVGVVPQDAGKGAAAEESPPSSAAAVTRRAPARQGMHQLATVIISKLEELSPARLTWRQLASLLNKSPEGGYFRGGKKDALASGRIVEEGDYVRAAQRGAGGLKRPAAIALWKSILKAPSPAIIDALNGKGWETKAALAGKLSYSPDGGYFRAGLTLLRQNGVTEENGDLVRLAQPLPGQVA